jgi:site-specific DNA-methyltransferase (adenine-specific)
VSTSGLFALSHSAEQLETTMKTLYDNSGILLLQGDTFQGMRRLQDHSVDLILADLPYGTTACKWDSVLPLDKLWAEYKRVAKPNAAIVLTAAQPFTWRLCASNPEMFRYELIWEKPNGTNPMLVHKQPFRTHENILVFYTKQPTYNPQKTFGHSTYSGFESESKGLGEVYGEGLKSKHSSNKDGSRFPRSVQRFKQERGSHPTKKPVDMFRWLIRSYTNPGDLVLDNVVGGGTTAVAAALENRKCVGIDRERKYLDMAINTLESFNVYANTNHAA